MTKITSCPVCRGEIHAIAGRCKHCKADLVELRERASRAARAQAIGATVPPMPRVGFLAAAPRPETHPPMAAMHGPGPAMSPPPPVDEPAFAPAESRPPTEPGPFGPEPYQAPMAGLPPPHGTPPYGIGFAGARARRGSSWSRRWPFVVSAVALLAIGISIGVLAERWRNDAQSRAGSPRRVQLSRSPAMVPDHMPQPLMPAPESRRAPDQAGPREPRPQGGQGLNPLLTPGEDTDDDDGEPDRDPANPGSRFSQPPDGSASAFRTFTTEFTDSLCEKLTQCGLIDSATQSMCRVFAKELDPDGAAAKVARGECSFNQEAADACLRAVADLECEAGASDRVMEWLMAPHRVGKCAEAYTCR